ncbi:glycoside hydrolase family 127 protein [Streptomyces sp. MNU89]|uniref:glycoside hydrolase family 127 protein n=1 Tax=Streptomyces sp. MNU89 TaxID=2560025 RepID=UPI001E35E0A8|nr:glycoside hydrolase family 127 protein [Streptomyces sp. MNU89]MCC9738240.1 glycoside hydrolase family 127 protein [Streptomyces sp. MNU89]
MTPPVNRRQLLLSAAGAAALASASRYGPLAGRAAAASRTTGGARGAAGAAGPLDEAGVVARPFAPGRVRPTTGRWRDNMDRTLEYLRFVDTDRLLGNHRMNHGLDTRGAEPCGGWEAPDFEFRTHSQGHFLSAWAQAWALTGEAVFEEKAAYMVAELAACQTAPAGFNTGYLSGFPESDFDTVETGRRKGVPYYCLHKTLAGLLDVWRLTGNTEARDVLLALAGWVEWRTGRLTYEQMQTTLRVEFGGMNAVLTDLCLQTGDERWLVVARRFDHAAVLDPLAAGEDRLAGLHANTQVPKIVGAAREYKATGDRRYRAIAVNFWDIVTGAHTYVIGGNSQAEHFREPGAIARYLTDDTCESCNTYNMLRLTRELFTLGPERVAYADYYEAALLNQMLGQQNPDDPHGHVTYFTPLTPGSRRGVGPAWGGGTWSTDYDSFWCCQGTGLETHTQLMDSVYFQDDAGLYVNLFIPSVLDWAERAVTVEQTTDFPASDTTTLRIDGAAGEWALRIRIPGWTSGATVRVNGEVRDIAADPGGYAVLRRTWAPGDTVTVRLPMDVRLLPAPDDEHVQAVAYGPVVLSGAYGDQDLGGRLPVLATDSLTATDEPLTFTATADNTAVTLIPFYDNRQNYTVYWATPGD